MEWSIETPLTRTTGIVHVNKKFIEYLEYSDRYYEYSRYSFLGGSFFLYSNRLPPNNLAE